MTGGTALILGATGAVGKSVVQEVLTNGTYDKVITVGRRVVKLEDSIPQNLLVQEVIDFDQLENYRPVFKGVNVVFCCLGAARSDMANKETFVRVDQTYVLHAAKLIAEENRPSDGLVPVHFLYCSTPGASKTAPFMYMRVKGETEDALKQIGFSRVSIYRPTALLTDGPREVPRFGDGFFRNVLGPISRTFKLHLTVHVSTVAKAMRKTAEINTNYNGTETQSDLFFTKDIEEIAAE